MKISFAAMDEKYGRRHWLKNYTIQDWNYLNFKIQNIIYCLSLSFFLCSKLKPISKTLKHNPETLYCIYNIAIEFISTITYTSIYVTDDLYIIWFMIMSYLYIRMLYTLKAKIKTNWYIDWNRLLWDRSWIYIIK